jgi:rhamnose utilization protein RhaD (predicted bifunctional aldolase and dehydrogenase)
VSARAGVGRFWVKASGAALETLEEKDVVECVSAKILPILDRPLMDPDDFAQVLADVRADPASPLPSVESALHAWLLEQEDIVYAAFLTPPHCLALASSKAGEVFCEQRLFPEQVAHCGVRSIWVPYTEPGAALAREVRSRLAVHHRRVRETPPRLLVLQNRGVVALGPDPGTVVSSVMMAEHSARVFALTAQLGGPNFLQVHQVRRLEVHPNDTRRFRAGR